MLSLIMMKIFAHWTGLRFDSRPLKSGFSLLETLIAISLITLAASFTVQTIFFSDTTQNTAQISQRSWSEMASLAAHIKKAFAQDSLVFDNDTHQLIDSTLPDFIASDSLLIWPILGTSSRYQDNQAACVLAQDAEIDPPQITFTTNCLSADNGSNIASLMDALWDKDVPVIFGVAGSGGLCSSIAAPSQTADDLQADLSVLDVDCILNADNISSQASQEIYFPRYMVFSKETPSQFYFALFEPIAQQIEGATLEMPELLTAKSGLPKQIEDINLSALSENTALSLRLFTDQSGARLWADDDYGAEIEDNNSSQITIMGSISQIQQLLNNFYYESAEGFFGDDMLFAEMRFNQHLISKQTILNITPNCGEQETGTAIRFDLGYFDNNSFVLVDYLTSVSLVADFPPQRYYGYCRHYSSNTNPRQIYDQANGLRRLVSDPFDCSSIEDPSDELDRYYATSSPAIEFDAEDTLTVFIYEEETRYTKDRFSLFFVFGDFGNDCNSDPDDAGIWAGKCEAVVSLSNLEAGRDLEDIEDIYSFADDPGEYAGDDGTAVISNTGIITMSPKWAGAHDGIVVPLRLPDNDSFGADNLPELRNYAQDPDNDGKVNPTLELISVDTLHHWRIRALNEDASAIAMRELSYNLDNTDERSVIQLNIGESRQCEPDDS